MAHRLAPTCNSRLHGPQRDVENIGDLFVTQIFHIAQHHSRAKHRIDSSQSILYHDALLTIQRVVVRRPAPVRDGVAEILSPFAFILEHNLLPAVTIEPSAGVLSTGE